MQVGDRFILNKEFNDDKSVFIIYGLDNDRVLFHWTYYGEYRQATYELSTVERYFRSGIWINLTEERRKKLKKINESR